jgi:MYXO-CTERM domain-containing protein
MVEAVTALVTKYGGQVPFGLELYTSSAFDDQGCYDDTKIDVQPAHDTAKSIIAKLKAAKPEAGTNTGEAIKRARVAPALGDMKREQFILLVTDGDPNCNEDDFTNAAYTVSEIKKALGQNPTVKTFVVGFDGSKGVSPSNLNAMAKAGGTPREGCTGQQGNQCYYSANKPTDLIEALDKIINQVLGGEFGMTTCDDSCYANGCEAGEICVVDELDPKPHCVPNPCHIEMCGQNEYCRQGMCVRTCPQCKTGEKCVDGSCVADPCHGVSCGDGAVCNPFTGSCIANPCIDKQCKAPTVCDPVTGGCVDDQCRLVSCPEGSLCRSPSGYCESTKASGGNTSGTGSNRRGGGGCAVTSRDAGNGTTLLALAMLLAVAALLRRRP